MRRPRIVMASAYIERARRRLVKERDQTKRTPRPAGALLTRERHLDDAIRHLEIAEQSILMANDAREEDF